ncbi:MAG TPA: hypothetical protein VI248_24415 [Kineosporiaceae bacterium]
MANPAVTARQVWRAVRTPIAIGVNGLGLALFVVVVERMGFLDLHVHRAAGWKIMPGMWLLGCLLLSTAAVFHLRKAVVIKNRGDHGIALGLARTARTLFYMSAIVAVMPVVFLAVIVLLPIPRLN